MNDNLSYTSPDYGILAHTHNASIFSIVMNYYNERQPVIHNWMLAHTHNTSIFSIFMNYYYYEKQPVIYIT